ncbi:MAG TPA: hypothetical protein VHG92_04370 [Afifellaceae bacterium]|nr:hypothetical protein [Afifellaceae bacterium]
MSRVGDAAKQAGAQAQDAASSAASHASDRAMRVADRQLRMGADIVGDVADAVRAAAERLDGSEPQIAQLAWGAAERIEDFSDTIRNQSAEELWQASADLARRRPAVVFGATAALGFLLVRFLHPGYGRSRSGGGGRQFERDDDSGEWNRQGGSGSGGYEPSSARSPSGPGGPHGGTAHGI